ncbi:MAG: MFS transporter [Candidatus Hodarchaeales archaeon]|jgi:MFS family permease
MAEIFKLTKITYVIVFGASIGNLAAGILEPTIAPYLVTLGASSQDIGFILSARFFVVALASIPLALFASQLGLQRFLYLSAVCSILGGLFLVFLKGTTAVFVFYIALGFSMAIFNGPGIALIAENTGTKRVAAFALFFSSWMIPSALGALISAIWFKDTDDFRKVSNIFPLTMYLLIFSSCIFILLLYFVGKYSSSEGSSEESFIIKGQFKILFAPIVALPLSLLFFAEFLSGAGAGASLPYLSPYLESLGATPTELSALVFFLNVLMGIATQLSAPLSRKFGDLNVFLATMLLSISSLLGIVFSDDLIISAIFFIFRGTFANMNAPIAQSRILTYIETSVRATGSAAAGTVRWLGWTIFSPISGRIIDDFGYEISFIFTSFIYLIALILFISTCRRYKNLEEISEIN